MEYIKVSKAAENWGVSARRVRKLCATGKIAGVIRKGNLYMIPKNAKKPPDGRRSKPALTEIIEEKKQKLSCMRPLTQGETAKLAEEFLVEFTYNSNAIEGSTLTLKETAMVLEGITVDQKPLKDHLEAIGHRDAFLYIQDIASKNIPLSEHVIKNIHALVLMHRPNDKGVYRRIPVQIMGAYTQPVQPYEIETKMAELLAADQERKTTMPAIERIARFHLEFEGIHPFIDGNGRTGRLILNLDLIRNGYPPVNIKFADRKRYYNAFDAFYRDGNAGEMIDLLAAYVDQQLDAYLALFSQITSQQPRE